MDIDFSRRLARARFTSRASRRPEGGLAYELADGSGHVALSNGEWDAVGHAFTEATRSSARWAQVSLLLSLPAYVVFILLCNLPPAAWLLQAVPRSLQSVILLAPLPGFPVAAYLRHSHHVKRVSAAIEATLADLPRVPAPPPDPSRFPLWLDIASLLLVGPGLAVAAIGQAAPSAFRNTPLSGAHFGPLALAGLLVLGLRLLWPRLRRRSRSAG